MMLFGSSIDLTLLGILSYRLESDCKIRRILSKLLFVLNSASNFSIVCFSYFCFEFIGGYVDLFRV